MHWGNMLVKVPLQFIGCFLLPSVVEWKLFCLMYTQWTQGMTREFSHIWEAVPCTPLMQADLLLADMAQTEKQHGLNCQPE